MSDPYSNKPSLISEPNQWHELSFQISVDASVDWDNVDLRQWARTVARYTALMMAESHMSEDEQAEAAVLKTLIMNVKVDRISFVDDEGLHKLIDKFDETGE